MKPTLYFQFKANENSVYTHPYILNPPHQLYPFISLTSTQNPATHKHIQQPQPWTIHLWIRIHRLYITVWLTIWLFHFKTTWFMTVIVFVFRIWLELVFFYEGLWGCVCIQEILFLPVYDCTHVQADIFKSSHSAFFHCMQISRLIIHQEFLHAALEGTPRGWEQSL